MWDYVAVAFHQPAMIQSAPWFRGILVVGLIMTTALQAIRPMASYKALELGAGAAEVGFVASCFALLSLIVAMPIGRWVDRIGEPRFIVAGAATMSAGAFWMVAIDSIPLLAVSQAILGLGHIAMVVGIQTMIANHSHSPGGGDRDGRYGAFAVVVALGQLVGPAVGGFLAGGVGRATTGDPAAGPATDVVFAVAAAAALVGALVGVTVLRAGRAMPARVREAPTGEAIGPALRRVLAVPSMPQAMLASITVLSSVNILIAYLPAYGEATGLSVETVGLLLAIRAGASMASRILMVPMRRLLGRRNLLVACMMLPAAALVVMVVIGTVAALFAAMVLIGFGLGLGQPLTLSWVAGRAPADLRGTAVAARLGGNRVGQFLLPAAVGIVASFVGLGAVFWSLSILLTLGATFVMTGPFLEDANDQTT